MKNEEKYTQFALVQEMMETPAILKNFKLKDADDVIAAIKSAGKVFFTGEGSSRIFPAKIRSRVITNYHELVIVDQI